MKLLGKDNKWSSFTLACSILLFLGPGATPGSAESDKNADALVQRFQELAETALQDRKLTLSTSSREELDSIILHGAEMIELRDASVEDIEVAEENLVLLIDEYVAKQAEAHSDFSTDTEVASADAGEADNEGNSAAEVGGEEDGQREQETKWCPPPRLWPWCYD